MINENCCIFIVLKAKELQAIITLITEDKVTEIFCMADDFCKFFDAMMSKYTLKCNGKRNYHRNSTMSKAEVMLVMILFHDSGYRWMVSLRPDTIARSMLHILPLSSKIRRLKTFFFIVVSFRVIGLRSSKSCTLYTPEKFKICQQFFFFFTFFCDWAETISYDCRIKSFSVSSSISSLT